MSGSLSLSGLSDSLRILREVIVKLTNREFEILLLLVRGYSTKKIAKRLYIVEYTVRNHITSILKKMEVHSRGEAVAKYTEETKDPPALFVYKER